MSGCLLPLLKSIHKNTHLRNFAGQTLGIDAYGWLHRGTVSCAIELAQGKPTRKHIEFALNRVRMLIHFGVKPFLVFDGDYLPSKAHTEKERAARRKESKRLGLELLRMDKAPQAYLELQKAVDVTPLMARELIEELKALDVPYIVAPFEADSQLAYLEKQGVISGVISEDSDLLVFGVQRLLTKLDQYGECVMINRADFTACREISLVGWTDREFRMMAMLSGCDYLPGIDKMGLKTAYRLVRKHKVIERVVRTVQFDGKMKVPAGYLEAFTKAERTFLYQWVFCPEGRRLINLNKVPAELDVDTMPFLGKPDEPEVAAGVAAGDLDPNTKQPLFVAPRVLHPGARTSIVQTPNEKPGKPISEYFKAKRTPLAELDPNSFTPSPSQQRLLQTQQNAAWSASRVPASSVPALDRASASVAPSSAPHASRRSASEQWPSTQRASPKRQRLCSDSVLAASMNGNVGLETATSRFFSKHTTQPSPSLRKASGHKKTESFELWTDGPSAGTMTAADIARHAAEDQPTPSPKKRKKLAVFADPAPKADATECEADEPSASISQGSAATDVTATSQDYIADADTPTTSFESAASRSEHTVFSKGIDASFAALRSRYNFKPGSPQRNVARTKSAPLGSTLLLQRTPSNQGLRKKTTPTTDGISTAQSPEKADVVVPESSPIAHHTVQSADDHIDDEEWLAMEQREASPASTLAIKGSEDFIVPNSPSSASEDGRHKPKINLGRFAFAG